MRSLCLCKCLICVFYFIVLYYYIKRSTLLSRIDFTFSFNSKVYSTITYILSSHHRNASYNLRFIFCSTAQQKSRIQDPKSEEKECTFDNVIAGTKTLLFEHKYSVCISLEKSILCHVLVYVKVMNV